MIRFKWLAIAGASVLSFGAGWMANAQAPAQGQTFAIYCRGPLSTFRTDGGTVIRTPFKWAKDAATKQQPGAGECALPDRPPQGPEKAGDTSTIVGNLGPFDNLPVGTVGKVCVSRAGQNNELVVKEILRQLGHQTAPFHIPPLSDGGCSS
jgi:hypothetical protein